jgi:hypothetical protein
VSDEQAHAGHDGAGEHATPHLPPPSFVPITVAFSLALVFVGLLGDIRRAVGPAMWVAGLVLLGVSCAVWVRAARTEYLELPEDSPH